MAEIILDLSGKSGLASNFFGNQDEVTPRPERIYGISEGDLVGGIFNPFLRDGYLSPTTSTSVSLTLDVAADPQITSVEYDVANTDVYFGDGVKTVYTTSSLTDTSLAKVDTIEYNGRGYDRLYDLQMYQINGSPRMFFVGRGIPSTDTPLIKLGTQTAAAQYAATMLSVNPSGATKPSILNSTRFYDSAAGASATVSATASSGTNTAMFVIAYCVGGAASGVTFNGDAMSLSYVTGGATGQPSASVYYLANPDVTTANVVVTFDASVTHRLVYVIVTNNTDQSDPDTTRCYDRQTSESTGTIYCSALPSDINDLMLISVFSDNPFDIDTSIDISSELYTGLMTYGEEYLAVTTTTGYGLQVGHSAVPATNFDNVNITFSSNKNRDGAFIQKMVGDYAFMRIADNGFAYVFSDNHVHKIDGNTTGGLYGTITKDVLLFPGNFTITDAIDYRSRLYIVIHKYNVSVGDTSLNTFTGGCGIYVWNRVSTQLSSADYIELPGVREIKKIFASPDGELRLITISDSGLTELRQFGYNDSGGVVFPVVKTLGIGAYPQIPDGLSTAGDKIVWVANDGNIYANKGKSVTKLFQIKAPGSTTATLESNITSGALFYGNGDETGSTGFRSNKQAITFSYIDGSTHYIKKIYPFDLKTGDNSNQTPNQGDVYTGVKVMPITSKVNQVRIYNAPTANSGSTAIATVKLYFNQSTSATMPNGMTKTVTLDEAKRGYVDFHINKQYVHAIQLEVEWATGTPIGDDMYMPSYAVISYEDTTTKSPDNG